VGRAPEQVEEFVRNEVQPAITAFGDWKTVNAGELKV